MIKSFVLFSSIKWMFKADVSLHLSLHEKAVFNIKSFGKRESSRWDENSRREENFISFNLIYTPSKCDQQLLWFFVKMNFN